MRRFWFGYLGRRFASLAAPRIRNVGIIAHIDAGKTTTTERMLFYAGVTKRIGNVDTQDTVTDFLDAERERGITIQSAAITFGWKDCQINLIDTPGHADFNFEVVRSLRVLDGCVTILDAVSGVEALTEKVWKLAAERRIPCVVYVNKMDRAGAGFGRTVREVVAKLHTHVVLPVLPYFEGEQFAGVVDVVNMQRIKYVSEDGKQVEVASVLDTAERDVAQAARAALIDQLSELDEAVLDEFVSNEDVQPETLERAIQRLTRECKLVPVLCGSSFKNIGIQPLLEACVSYLPEPAPPPNAAELRLLAFKVRHDPQRGVMVFVRVYSGQLKKNATLFNTTTQQPEKVSKILRMQADEPVEEASFGPGEIAVLLGTKNTRTGDTLVAGGPKLSRALRQLQLQPIVGPPPVFFMRISPQNAGGLRDMKAALDILLREDPSLHLSYDEDAAQYLLSGMGELHLEIAVNRLRDQLGAKIVTGDVMITLKETLASASPQVSLQEASPAGGSTEVKLRITPNLPENSRSSNDAARHIFPLSDDNAFKLKFRRHPLVEAQSVQKSVEIGLNPVIARGGTRGFALHGLLFECEVAMSPECVDSQLVAPLVRAAASKALSLVGETECVLLEPVMSVRLSVPVACAGAVMADLTANRRGVMESLDNGLFSGDDEDSRYLELARSLWTPTDHTLHMSKYEDTKSATATVRAKVPLRKMVGYLSALRSSTQGRGTFEMEFAEFAAVPAQDIDEVLTRSQ